MVKKQTYIKDKANRDFIISDPDEFNCFVGTLCDRTEFRFSFDEERLGKHEIHLDRLQAKADELMQDLGVISTSI